MLLGLALASLNLSIEKVLVQWDANVILLQLLIIQQKVATYISQEAALASASAGLQRPGAGADKRLPVRGQVIETSWPSPCAPPRLTQQEILYKPIRRARRGTDLWERGGSSFPENEISKYAQRQHNGSALSLR